MNVLLVTVDSLRADAVYGNEIPTPEIQGLAAGAEVYTNAFAQGPFTTFSMPSLFTARYPSSLRYVEISESTVGVYIDDEPTLRDVLGEAGYVTAGFHSNPLLSQIFGFEEGFDTFDTSLPLSRFDRLPGRVKILADKLLRLARKHAYLPGEELTSRALDWLDSRPDDQPFFLWLHYMDPHGPYQPRTGNAYLEKFRAERLWRKAATRPQEVTEEEHRHLREWYSHEVTYTDRCLGELFDGFRQRGLLSETLCVLTADHGEAFAEHGQYSHPHQLYDELLHVPLLVADPRTSKSDVDDLVELIDVAPTLAHRIGTPVPDEFAGRPLSRVAERGNPVAISEANLVPNYRGSVRTPNWKYVRDVETEQLYDLSADPDEQMNVAGDRGDVASRLANRLQEHRERHSRGAGGDRAVARSEIPDEGVAARLRELGYLDD